MRKWSKKQWVLVSVLVYAIGIGALVFFYTIKAEDFFSSPTKSRHLVGFKKESRLDTLEKANWRIDDARPATEKMAPVTRIEGANDDFILNWQDEPKIAKTAQEENWTTSLLGDDKVELVAFASWVPQPEDELDKNIAWQVTPTFYDAKTLEPLSDEALDEWGIPKSFRSFSPPKKYPAPKIRLIFRTSGMEYVRFTRIEGGDMRTDAVVTYRLNGMGEAEPSQAKEGDWMRCDMALLAWHDTPVKFYAQVLTGKPQVKELAQKQDSQIVFDDLLRLQWRATAEREIDRKSDSFTGFEAAAEVAKTETEKLFIKPDPAEKKAAAGSTSVFSSFSSSHENEVTTALWLELEELDEDEEPDDDDFPITLLRVSSNDYLNHCGWINENGVAEWRWDWVTDNNGILIRSTRQMKDLTKPMRIVFLPKMVELSFEIGGLPDSPNSGDVEDLFELRVPRITLPENPESAEDRLLQFASVLTQNGWEIANLWDDSLPDELPDDRTFRNQTPQELLDWYLKVTPKAHVKYDEEEQVSC